MAAIVLYLKRWKIDSHMERTMKSTHWQCLWVKYYRLFNLHLSIQEDGCDIINLPGVYCVGSGDGSGVNQKGINHVAFEFKFPMPGKKYTTETYYKLPVYYVLQVLSQMVAKNAGEFANLCYIQESSTLLVGESNKVLWDKLKCILDDYSSSSQKQPTRKPKWSNEMLPCLRDFA